MTPTAAAEPIVRHERFAGEDWLFFPAIAPDVAIVRATTADDGATSPSSTRAPFWERWIRRSPPATTEAS